MAGPTPEIDIGQETVEEEAVPFVKTVLTEVRKEGLTFMAGSIAYQAFVSLIPLLILVFFAVSLVGDEQLAVEVVDFTKGFLPERAATLLGDSITGDTTSASASLVGFVTLIWGTLKVFRGLDTAFSEIYRTNEENSFFDGIVDGLVMLIAIGGAIIAAGIGVTIISLLPIPGDSLFVPLMLVGALVATFYPMYARFPDVDVSPREILPGVIVAAIGWTALQAIFGFYVEIVGGSSGGIFGAIILLLTWLYFGGMVLLLGAMVNAVLAGRRGETPLVGAKDQDETGDAVGYPDDADPDRLREKLSVERDRRRRAELERDNAQRDLDRLKHRMPADIQHLRKRDRLLRHRLRWERRPLPVRLLLRVLGWSPPDPSVDATATTSDDHEESLATPDT